MQEQSITVVSSSPTFPTAAPDTAQLMPSLPVQGSVPGAAFLGSDNSPHSAPNLAVVMARHLCTEACEEAGVAEILMKEGISDVSI